MKHEEGKRLKLFMERENISGLELAGILKKTPSQISRYINGIHQLDIQALKILHIKFRLNYTWYFHGTGTMKVQKIEKRNIMTDLTDIQAGLGAVIASQDAMRELLERLTRDFYATKHGIE